MKDKIYDEMCELLKERPEKMQEFKLFHYKNQNVSSYLELFDTEFGDLYRSLQGSINLKSEILLNKKSTSKNSLALEKNDIYKAENTLRMVALIVLIMGVLGTLFMLYNTVWTEDYTGEKEFSATGLGMTIGYLLSTVTTWAVLNVISNISVNIFKLREQTERKD
ncbi:MAG: hypothetical protein LIP08_15275 [Bacteroides sp.]|nr:hypothetical protein [Bacteroides sp.]